MVGPGPGLVVARAEHSRRGGEQDDNGGRNQHASAPEMTPEPDEGRAGSRRGRVARATPDDRTTLDDRATPAAGTRAVGTRTPAPSPPAPSAALLATASRVLSHTAKSFSFPQARTNAASSSGRGSLLPLSMWESVLRGR